MLVRSFLKLLILICILLVAYAAAAQTQAALINAEPRPSPRTVEKQSSTPPFPDGARSQPSAPTLHSETYSVLVRQLPVEQLLFALARDAHLNVDILPGLHGRVSLKATDQTLPQILERIAGQVDLRYDIRDGVLTVGPDTPFIREYTIDSVNMARKSRGVVSISTSIASAGGAGGGTPNASSSLVENVSESQVWKTLEQNLRDMIQVDEVADIDRTDMAEVENRSLPSSVAARVNDKQVQTPLPMQTSVSDAKTSAIDLRHLGPVASLTGQAAPAGRKESAAMARQNNVIVNAEAGLVAVRASARHHRRVQRFLAGVQAGIARQVLIEATLVEVALDRAYQAGVDWSRLGNRLDNTLNIAQTLIGNNFGTGPVTTLVLNSNAELFHGSFAATLKLLEVFGKTRVLSSPKVMALNNQMALLKVVDEKVYFEIKASRTEGTDNAPARIDYTSSVKSVPVGVMLSVIPQISLHGLVSLNIRPTITRITSYKSDPTMALLGASVDNLVPEIQVREIESTLKLSSGQTAVLGGLMQESQEQQRQGVPLLMDLPWIGRFFRFQGDSTHKTELVIFLRPTIIDSATPDHAQSRLSPHLPSADSDSVFDGVFNRRLSSERPQ